MHMKAAIFGKFVRYSDRFVMPLLRSVVASAMLNAVPGAALGYVEGGPTGICTDYAGHNFACGSRLPPHVAPPVLQGPTPEQVKKQRDEKDLSEAALDANDKGVDAYKAGRYSDAVKYLTEALEYTPDDVSVQRNLAKARAALAAARIPNQATLAITPSVNEPRAQPLAAGTRPLRPPTYHVTTAIPVACIALGDIGKKACSAIGIAKLISELRTASSSKHALHEVLKVLARASGTEIVALSFPENYRMGQKIDLIEEMYRYEREVFEYALGRIQSEMIEDPVLAQKLTQFAIADSFAVQKLLDDAYSEARGQADLMQDTIQKAPNSTAVRLKCETVCGQLTKVVELEWRGN